MNKVLHALSLLTPFDVDMPKIRLGPNTDGGYVFLDNISPDQAIISYGISFEYQFDSLMAARGHEVYMFDHTIDGINASSPNMKWFKEGVAGADDEASLLYTVESHLRRHGIEGDRLILKIDVEGAEFEAFNAMPDHVLTRFEQIVMEVHDLYRLNDPAYCKCFVDVFTKINRHFTLFHVHANNYDGTDALHTVDGFPVSNLMELSYARTSMVSRRPNRTLYPTALDFPNVEHKDKMLWFFPYVPTSASASDFAICEQRADLVHKVRTSGLAV